MTIYSGASRQAQEEHRAIVRFFSKRLTSTYTSCPFLRVKYSSVMSVSAAASLRPLRGQCLRHATSGLLSVRLQSRSTILNFRAVIPLQRQIHTSRILRAAPINDGADNDLETKKNQLPQRQQAQAQAQPQITFGQFARRALGAGLRSLFVAMSPTGIKTAFKQSPGATSLGLAMCVSHLLTLYTLHVN